jgi:uncharacterized repeat protein (TIGR02543 family)
MKNNKFIVMGVLAMLLAFELVLVGCDNPAGSDTYTIAFEADGGTPAPADQNVENGGKATQPAAMTKTGYTFGGWYKEAAFTNLWNFTADTVSSNITLYAKWTLNSGNTNPEDLPYNERWGTWQEPDSTCTIDYTIDDDGIVTATTGGTAQADFYYTNISYGYTVEQGKRYKYVFEAWTEEGNRTMGLEYFNDEIGDLQFPNIRLSPTRSTFTMVCAAPIPRDGITQLAFQCANQLGTFYVKVLSITETEAPPQYPIGLFANFWEDGSGSNWCGEAMPIAYISPGGIKGGTNYKVTISGSTDTAMGKFRAIFIDRNTEWRKITNNYITQSISPGTFSYEETITTISESLSDLDYNKCYVFLENDEPPPNGYAHNDIIAVISNIAISIVEAE